MSTPSERHAPTSGTAAEDERKRILASATRLPPIEDTVFDDLTDEQDRVFWETINSA